MISKRCNLFDSHSHWLYCTLSFLQLGEGEHFLDVLKPVATNHLSDSYNLIISVNLKYQVRFEN